MSTPYCGPSGNSIDSFFLIKAFFPHKMSEVELKNEVSDVLFRVLSSLNFQKFSTSLPSVVFVNFLAKKFV